MKNEKQKISKSEIVRRYLITSDADRKIIEIKFPFIDFSGFIDSSEESIIRLLGQLEENNIEHEFLRVLKELE